MKFEIKMSYFPTAESKAAAKGDPGTTFELEGDLDAVKTYLKLAVGSNFNWGAVCRTDNLKEGDVDRWLIGKHRITGELFLSVFSFFSVDPEININTMRAAFEQDPKLKELNKLLGGGAF